MKRALVLRAACAIIGMAFSGCSSSNPTLPSGVTPLDSGLGERGIIREPDTRPPAPPASEAGAPYDSPGKDAKDAASDVPLVADTTTGIDSPPASKVTVTIQSPAAVEGVDGGAEDGGASLPPVVAKSDRLAPTVQVAVQSQGGDPTLDVVSLVKATITSTGSKSPAATITLNQTQYSVVPESGDKVYIFANTPFDLSGVAGDFYDLQVTATTAGGVAGTATLRIYIDGGPTITFLQPADATYVKGSVVVTAMVVDSRSSLADVTFSIGQYEIAPTAISSNGAQYSTTIDFGSFNPPLDGPQIVTITATNSNDNTSIASRKFTIDNDGPSITATKPATGDLIGKLISIEAKVDDPAGVMDSSVIAVVANGDVHFEVNLVKGTDGTYRQLFDTTQLPIFAIFPSVSFRAQDVLGNESSVGHLVSLDNTPPILDLDPPPNFRLVKKDGTCSWPFDPVGPDAIDDGSVVTQLFDIRARVEDRGNTPLTGTSDFIPIAKVDPASVKILILDDTSQPLVVDTSDPPDGFCDDINPELVPSVSPQSSKDAQLIDMVPLPFNAGAGDFSYQPDSGLLWDGTQCVQSKANPPLPLCDTTYSSMKIQAQTYLLAYAVQLSQPSIWTIPPIVSDGLQCAGRQFDTSNNLRDGWACAAVEASDNLGNKQVSRPIRICLVATPGSTACTSAAAGGADIASVTLPSKLSGDVVVTTKSPVVGRAGAAIVEGDTLVFSNVVKGDTLVLSNVSFPGVARILGDHSVNPEGSTGTQFILTDVKVTPAELWVPTDSSTPNPVKVAGTSYKSMGTVGFVFQSGAAPQVVGSGLDGIAGPVFLLTNEAQPSDGDRLWSIDNVQATGFRLTETTVDFSGFATASSVLPDCTGTVVKKTTGSTVDGTKPCKPYASFPKYEELYLK